MANDIFIRLLTALLKHQVRKLVGEEALGVIGEELASIGGNQLDAWIEEKGIAKELEKAADFAHECFIGKVKNPELEQWMQSLPLNNLPSVLNAINKLPISSDETILEKALREAIILNWKNISSEDVNHGVNVYISCLRKALLPLEKQQLTIVGRSVLRTEEKVDKLLSSLEIYQAIRQKDYSHSPYPEKVERKRKLKVFLCHSSFDKKPVRELYSQLESRGFKPWLDEKDILPGQNWRQAIKKAIETSDVVIVCLSGTSTSKAGYVHKEISMALDIAEQQPDDAIFIIPLRLESCTVPDRLSHLQWLDYFTIESINRLIEALRIRLKQLYLD